jgi:hypothetical protein
MGQAGCQSKETQISGWRRNLPAKRCKNEAEITTYLHAYSIFDMNVAGATVRGVSTMYATTVGSADATASVIIAPDADQVKISI